MINQYDDLLSGLTITRELAITSHGDSRTIEVNKYAIMIVENSDAMISINNRFYSLDEFNVIFMQPGTRFFCRYGTHCNYYLVYPGLDQELQGSVELRQLYNEMFHQRFFMIKPPDETDARLLMHVIAYVHEKVSFVRESSHTNKQHINNSCVFLISLLHEFQAQYDLQLSNPVEPSLPEQIAQYIDKNYAHHLSLTNFETEFYLSRHHLCREFKKHYGVGIIQYLNMIRLRHASRLLENSNESIQSIIEKCGFSNYQNFYRQFVKRFGSSPVKYRKGIKRLNAQNS